MGYFTFPLQCQLSTLGGEIREWEEPEIVIDRHVLTMGQAMTIRVAIEAFAADLASHGLGNDDHGKKMTIAYLDRINDIREIFSEWQNKRNKFRDDHPELCNK